MMMNSIGIIINFFLSLSFVSFPFSTGTNELHVSRRIQTQVWLRDIKHLKIYVLIILKTVDKYPKLFSVFKKKKWKHLYSHYVGIYNHHTRILISYKSSFCMTTENDFFFLFSFLISKFCARIWIAQQSVPIREIRKTLKINKCNTN